MSKDEAINKLEMALKEFWKEHGEGVAVNAKHTYVNVEPKFIVGNRVNTEVAKRIIGVYLSELTSDKIVDEEIMITQHGFKIFEEGQLVLEITNQKMVDSLNNKINYNLLY